MSWYIISFKEVDICYNYGFNYCDQNVVKLEWIEIGGGENKVIFFLQNEFQ